MLDLISDYLRERRHSHERLDGTIRGDIRQATHLLSVVRSYLLTYLLTY